VLGDRITGGAIVTDTSTNTKRVRSFEGSHPVPDENGVRGTRRILESAAAAGRDTLVLAVITGGGSALLPAPTGEISLNDVRTVTNGLLSSGASIHEINAVRKHLSDVKGGRLARVGAPATIAALVISDVVGNDLDVIASGLIVPDSSTYRDAVDIVERYGLSVPESVKRHLRSGVEGDVPETPKEGASCFDDVHSYILANGFTALSAAEDIARGQGYETVLLSSRVRGEAREVAKTHVAVAEEILAAGNPVRPPAIVLSGGETTVTMDNGETGGPNQEFALSGSVELSDPGVVLASIDTDGIDGASDAAGAIVDRGTATPVETAREALLKNDSYSFLDGKNALIDTGPTGTNVNDLQIVVVGDAENRERE
jgi:hydroxypyruvate reductase